MQLIGAKSWSKLLEAPYLQGSRPLIVEYIVYLKVISVQIVFKNSSDILNIWQGQSDSAQFWP